MSEHTTQVAKRRCATICELPSIGVIRSTVIGNNESRWTCFRPYSFNQDTSMMSTTRVMYQYRASAVNIMLAYSSFWCCRMVFCSLDNVKVAISVFKGDPVGVNEKRSRKWSSNEES